MKGLGTKSMGMTFTNYLTVEERRALQSTEDWLKIEPSRFKKVLGFTRRPLEYAYNKVPESVRESIAGAILKVLVSVRDGSADFVSEDSVRQTLQDRHGIFVDPLDHFRIDVLNLDGYAQELISATKNACTVEGAATGVAGLPGIVVDVPILYGLLFRLISQLSVCYGFSIEANEERTHLMKVLEIGHQLEREEKIQGMRELEELQELIKQEIPPVEVQRFAVQKGLQTMARHLGLALTQRKLAQSVVLLGGVIGAGVNRQLAGEVGEVAFHAYRRRYLVEVARLRQEGLLPGPGETRGGSIPKPPSYD